MTLARNVALISVAALLSLGAQCAGLTQLSGFVPAAGTARDVVVDAASGLAYVASDEFGVSVADVRNPQEPVVLGAPLWSFRGTRLAKSGALVVATSREDGLRVVDVSNPVLPVTVGAIQGIIAGGVAISGGFAFVRIEVPGNPPHCDLAVVDVRVPSSPTLVSQIVLPGGDEVEVVGSRAYVTTGAELQIFDVATPASPRALGKVAIPGGARDLTVSGSYAYVGNLTSLQVVDVSNPSAPLLAASLAGAAAAPEVDGTRLYLVSGDFLRVVDVTNPRAPRLLGSGASFAAWAVDVQGAYAYLASPRVDLADGLGGLYVSDVSLPASQRVVSQAIAGVGNAGVAAGNGLAVTTSRETGLHVIDVSDRALPERVGGLDVIALGVAQAGSYAYVRIEVPGSPPHMDLAVVDLRNPASPTIVSQLYLPGGDEVELAGSLVYVTTGTQLRIFDATDPRSLRSVASLSLPGGARDLALTTEYAVVGNATSVHVVDIRDPSRPALLGTLATGTTALAAWGSRFYSVYGATLRVVNISNPAAPTVIASGNSFGAANVDAANAVVLLASPTNGLAIYSVFADGALSVPALHDLPGAARSVKLVNGTYYVGDSASMVDVFAPPS